MAVHLSKLTSKSQTVIPREIRARLELKPGDVVRYRLTEAGVVIDKLPQQSDEDSLASFSEWTSPSDDEAYGGL